MSDPSLDLQKAIVAALRADAGVEALVVDRIYDRVPPTVQFPYVSIGAESALEDDPGGDEDCGVGYEVTIGLDVWSRAVGKPEMKRIAGAVRAALHLQDLELDNHRLVLLEHVATRYLTDPDGLTSHGALDFRALIDGEPPSG